MASPVSPPSPPRPPRCRGSKPGSGAAPGASPPCRASTPPEREVLRRTVRRSQGGGQVHRPPLPLARARRARPVRNGAGGRLALHPRPLPGASLLVLRPRRRDGEPPLRGPGSRHRAPRPGGEDRGKRPPWARLRAGPLPQGRLAGRRRRDSAPQDTGKAPRGTGRAARRLSRLRRRPHSRGRAGLPRRWRGDDGRVVGHAGHGPRRRSRPRGVRLGLRVRPEPHARRREAGRGRRAPLPALGGGEDGMRQRVVQWVRGPRARRRVRKVLRRWTGLHGGGVGVGGRERGTGTRLAVELCGIPLQTPLIPASGTLAREALGEVEGVYGAMLPKTTTPAPRAGTPPPRVAETYAGMVNSIGLQNPGVERFLEGLDAFDLGIPLFVSAAGDTVEDFGSLCERLDAEERISAIELNLSCPNVECGGLTFCAGPASVEEVVAACRAAAPGRPLFAKLTHEGVIGNARAAEAAGADALTVMNTIPALTIDAKKRSVLVRGGLSGPAVKPAALKAVYG